MTTPVPVEDPYPLGALSALERPKNAKSAGWLIEMGYAGPQRFQLVERLARNGQLRCRYPAVDRYDDFQRRADGLAGAHPVATLAGVDVAIAVAIAGILGTLLGTIIGARLNQAAAVDRLRFEYERADKMARFERVSHLYAQMVSAAGRCASS